MYSFINTTRDAVLADSGKIARSTWHRVKGLLGTKILAPGEGLLIERCQSVHTFFMAYPIDVVFVDRKGLVVHTSDSLAPFRVSRYVWRARLVIELPAGTIKRTGTRVGDLVKVEPA